MRVEGCSFVSLRQDRRQRLLARRAPDRTIVEPSERRARPTGPVQAHIWLQPAFGAHILGQIAPEAVMPDRAQRAYLQPEARTPLRPSLVQKA